MKVLLSVPLNPYSGYGNDGIGIARALMRAGVDLYLEPSLVQAPLPEDVAMLLTKTLTGPFDLFLCHVDPALLEISPPQRRASKVAVAWSMWEFSNLHGLKGRSSLRKRLKDFDLFLGYDQNTCNGFSEYFSGNIQKLQGGFSPEGWPKAERDWYEDRFAFCLNGQLHDRKNPFVAINAFKELKHDPDIEFEGAELHLHTTVLTLHPAIEQTAPKLRIHNALWDHDTLYQFYASQHVLLAPSKGEGKNLPALEMQATGGTVIATNWSGHTEWLDPECSLALDYRLGRFNQFDDSECAHASTKHMKELMLKLYQDRDLAKSLGDRAAEVIPDRHSWDTVIGKLLKIVEDL